MNDNYTKTKNTNIKDFPLQNIKYGLYFHIPFCSRICSYCDFYKTSLYTSDLLNSYIKALEESFSFFHSIYPLMFYSLYLGGGSPGIYTKEYESLFKKINPFLDTNSEKTIELNPTDINEENLSIWKSLGINRVSIGIQSFNDKVLHFLNRSSLPSNLLLKKIELTKKYFSNINIDLIYGIPLQKQESIFFNDLDLALSMDIEHLSLYCLTYNKTTPLGLKLSRNIIHERSSNTLASMYDKILNILNKNYIHEEISNWAIPKKLAYHSNLYWSGGYYLGIGASSHGYLPYFDRDIDNYEKNKVLKFLNTNNLDNKNDLLSKIGIRYFYPYNIKEFISNPHSISLDSRTLDSWLIEYIGACLRSINGINTDLIKDIHGSILRPNKMLDWALKKGLIYIEEKNKKNFLYLKDSEWFKENYWDKVVIDSFIK